MASWTLFSPHTRWPGAITGTIAPAAKVFETATRVPPFGGRPAVAQASAISRRTAVRPTVESCRTVSDVIAADPYCLAASAATAGGATAGGGPPLCRPPFFFYEKSP